MSLTRVYLLAMGGFFAAFGIAYVVRPAEFAALAELQLPSSTALIEVQGFYGGQLLALGLLMLLGVQSPRFAFTGLLVAATSLGGTAIGRILGVLAQGTCPPAIAAALLIETTGACLAVFLLRQESRDAPET